MLLGIDHGLKNIGLAISEGSLAQPYKTIHKATELEKITKDLKVTKIIVGISEGKSKDRAIGFGKKLKNMLGLPVEFVDETLSTHEAGLPAGRQGGKDHGKAAAIILQRYLDDHV